MNFGNKSRAKHTQELLTPPVSRKAAHQIVELLQSDPELWQTIAKLEEFNLIKPLIVYVSYLEQRRTLMQLLGQAARFNLTVRNQIEPNIAYLPPQWEVLYTIERLGVRRPAPAFDRRAYNYLVGSKSSPFTGSGASEINPKDAVVPVTDKAALFSESLIPGRQTTENLYKNPTYNIGQLNYLNSLSQTDRMRQAELLLRVQVNSVMPEIYGVNYPSRAEVIRVAAELNSLEPELVAAIILAEQRDQSYNEDAADYAAARYARHNSSIGLGQVTVSTAQRDKLFSDLMSQLTISVMPRYKVILMLADDVVNIFAVARYIRKVANDGAPLSAKALVYTHQVYRGLTMSAYSRHSSEWSAANIAALGSEYTSKAWDNNLQEEWGFYVYECYRDVKASGVF